MFCFPYGEIVELTNHDSPSFFLFNRNDKSDNGFVDDHRFMNRHACTVIDSCIVLHACFLVVILVRGVEPLFNKRFVSHVAFLHRGARCCFLLGTPLCKSIGSKQARADKTVHKIYVVGYCLLFVS